MDDLKLLSLEAVPRALDKAERYRLLNEPNEAQSICLDVLAVDPDNQLAIATMILALTDEFDRVGIILRGELVALGTIDELKAKAEMEGNLEEVFLKLTGGEGFKESEAPS